MWVKGFGHVIYKIQNEMLIVEVDSCGAEWKSVTDKKSQKEYLWNKKIDAWQYCAPILFPVIGRLKMIPINGMESFIPCRNMAFVLTCHLKCINKKRQNYICIVRNTRNICHLPFSISIGNKLHTKGTKFSYIIYSNESVRV